MKRRPLPDVEYLRELFLYEPDTGLLRWRVDRGGTKAGDVAGARRGESGYVQVSVDCKLYRAHLIIFKMVMGREPVAQIDHENTIKFDNRWDNLREATKSQNQANIGLIASNTSGFKGVSQYRAGEARGLAWQATIGHQGRSVYIGHFATREEAASAYEAKAIELFGEFARVA